MTTARSCGHPVVLAEATRICATPLRRQSRAGEAVRLLRETIRQLDGAAACREKASIVAAAGSLALTAAYSAALAGQEADAHTLVDEAADAAGRLASTTQHGTAGLTMAQVQLYQVGVHHMLGQNVAAVRIAQQIDPRMLPPGERRARLTTDTARALFALGDHERAFAALLTVEAAAREEAARPSVRALTGELLLHRPRLTGLVAFADRTSAAPA